MINRRSTIVLALGFCLAISGCGDRKQRSSIRKKEIMLSPLTLEESKFLSQIEQRRTNLGGRRLKISNRVVDNNERYENFTWENTDFENCDFIGCSMFAGFLKDVHFSNCLFYEVRWDGGRWEEVTFRDCAWSGAFDMGVEEGRTTLSFESCEFIGSTKEELGYGSKADYFGGIGGTDGEVIYHRCKFERTYINGGRKTLIRDCGFKNVVISGQPDSAITLDKVAAAELVNFGSGNFSNVTIKNSVFSSRLTFNDATIEKALFENLHVNLDLTSVKAKSIQIRNVEFTGATIPKSGIQYGLTSESAKISSLTIDSCSFGGHGSALYLSGEDISRRGGEEFPEQSSGQYSTDIGDLTIRNTPITNGEFRNMRIRNLLLENLGVNGADFTGTKIEQFSTDNVNVVKNIKLTNAVIRKKNTNIF